MADAFQHHLFRGYYVPVYGQKAGGGRQRNPFARKGGNQLPVGDRMKGQVAGDEVGQNLRSILRPGGFGHLLQTAEIIRRLIEGVADVILRHGGFDQVGGNVVLHGLVQRGKIRHAGNDNDSAGTVKLADLLNQRKAVHARHAYVGDNDIGTMAQKGIISVVAVANFRHQTHISLFPVD